MGGADDDDDNDGKRNVRWESAPKPKRFAAVKKWGAHFGLFLALVIYTGIGAWIFQSLESENELEDLNSRKAQLIAGRDEFKKAVLESTKDENLRFTIHTALDDYEKIIMKVSDGDMDQFMNNSITPETSWNYVRSAFFASTVLTTIGYGDMAPETFSGRLFCIIFALIGIPFTLTVIADLGKLMASLLSHAYKRCKAHMPSKFGVATSKFKKSMTVGASVGFLLFYIAAGGAVFDVWENWGFFDSFYFCFITMTTIGLGDMVPKNREKMLYCTIYILVGLALTSTAIELVRSQYADSWRKMRELSARLQGLSGLAESLRKYGDNINLDVSVLQDLKEFKKALAQSGKVKREGSIWKKFWESEDGFEPTESGEPRLIQIIIYESSV